MPVTQFRLLIADTSYIFFDFFTILCLVMHKNYIHKKSLLSQFWGSYDHSAYTHPYYWSNRKKGYTILIFEHNLIQKNKNS